MNQQYALNQALWISFRVYITTQQRYIGPSLSLSDHQSSSKFYQPKMTWFATEAQLTELECIPPMKEENYETICGSKNSNHAILAENIIRHLYYRESEITDDVFLRNLRMTLWASASRGSGDSQRFITSSPGYYRTLVNMMSFVGTIPSANICLDQLKRCKAYHFAMLEMHFHPPCNLFISAGDTSWMTSNMDYLGHHCLPRQLDKIQYRDRSWQSFSFHCMPVLNWGEKVKNIRQVIY